MNKVSRVPRRRCELEHTMLRNLSWPAVSHSCSLTFSPSLYTFFVTKKAPVVDVVFLGSNLSWVYRCNKLVFPTPEGKEGGTRVRRSGQERSAGGTDQCCP